MNIVRIYVLRSSGISRKSGALMVRYIIARKIYSQSENLYLRNEVEKKLKNPTIPLEEALWGKKTICFSLWVKA